MIDFACDFSMISQRAWLVGVVGFCFYLITIVNDLPSFYYALTWLAAGVLGSSLGTAFLSLIGLRCAWRAPREIVTENFSDDGAGPVVEMQLANAGTLNKTGVLVEVQLQRVGDEALFVRRYLMEALPSGSSIATALPLQHLRRGRYKVLETRLIGSDVLGLFSIRKRVPPGVDFGSVLTDGAGSTPGRVIPGAARGDEIIIGPAALAKSGAMHAPTSLSRGGGSIPMTRSLGQGEDIRGTRLYAPGDDLRHVHWKSTARKGQLVVKEFHHTLQEQTLVIWDGDAPAGEAENRKRETGDALEDDAGRRYDIGFNAHEWSLRLAASLCRALVESRRPCALLRLDDAPLALGIGEGGNEFALSMNQVGEALADAGARSNANLTEAFAPFSARWAGGEIYIVTSAVSPDATALVSRARLAGAQVVIGLIDADAFSPRAREHAGERVKTGPFKLRSATAARVEYSSHAQALRQAGARVVMVAPSENSRDFNAPILSAVQAMMESRSEKIEAAHEVAAACEATA